MPWINAERELPDEEGRYLVLYESTDYRRTVLSCIKLWDGKRWKDTKYQKNVRCWMPVPDAPEWVKK